MINMDLARQRGLSSDIVAKINTLHVTRECLNLYAVKLLKELNSLVSDSKASLVKDIDRLIISKRKNIVLLHESWELNEFTLQDLWGFPQDTKFHRFWEFGGCTCPKMDNADMYPYRRVYRQDCIIHGWP